MILHTHIQTVLSRHQGIAHMTGAAKVEAALKATAAMRRAEEV